MAMDCHPEDSSTVKNNAHCIAGQRRLVGQVTIDTLPGDALIYVFDFYVAQASVEAWHTLVHVCRRWRTLIFASPRRLNLRIACTNKTLIREKLDIWPALPIVISGQYRHPTTCLDSNIKAAFKLNDRVCQLTLSFSWKFDEFFAALEEPFPVLTDMNLSYYADWVPVSLNPVKFMGGSTNLRSLSLTGISIPGLPKLLLSSPDLVILRLEGVPILGFFPPDALVTALSALTRLKVLHIVLNKRYPDWESRHLPLPPRAILPSLTKLKFKGAREYLEDLVARIDVPLLDHLDVIFMFFYFGDPIVLDTPQLHRFISRIPKLQAPDKARIAIDITNRNFRIDLWGPGQLSTVRMKITSTDPERQFPCLTQFCRSPLFPLPALECLYIEGGQYSVQPQRDDAENTRWLELFQPFTFVKNLFLCMDFAPRIAPALQGLIGEEAMKVLPTLENVFIEDFQQSGSVHEAIGQFVAERQLSSQPISVSRWDRTSRTVPSLVTAGDKCSVCSFFVTVISSRSD